MPSGARQLLGEGVAEAHVDGALDLALAERGIDRAADVVGRDHPLDPPRFVEDQTWVA